MTKACRETASLQSACKSRRALVKLFKRAGLLPMVWLRVQNVTTGLWYTCKSHVHCRFERIKGSFCKAMGLPPHCAVFYAYNKKIPDEATPYEMGLTSDCPLEVLFSDVA